MENNNIVYSTDSQILAIKKYFQSLPTILHVEGERPFNLVHAEMIISDDDLKTRANEYGLLSPNEKQLALWARESDLINIHNGRTARSVLTYCGHNIVVGPGAAQCIRAETNTIVLDVAIYLNSVPLVVNHTQMEAFFVGDMSHLPIETQAQLNTIKDKINNHLKSQIVNKPAKDHARFFDKKDDPSPKSRKLNPKNL